MARCSEAATDLHDLMLCCEERGWQYTLESRAQLEIDDREIAPRGHMASVTTTRGYFAHVLGTNAQDALRAALTAVEAMDERGVKGPDVTAIRYISMDPAAEQNGAGYARAQLSPDVPTVTWRASPEQVTMTEDPGPPTAQERLDRAYREYRDSDAPEWLAFQSAIVGNLGGCCLPGAGQDWSRVKPVLIGTGERGH